MLNAPPPPARGRLVVHRSRPLVFLLSLSLGVWSSHAIAEPSLTEPLTPTHAIALAVEMSPTLRTAVLARQRTRAILTGEESRFVPNFSASMNYNRSTSTSLSGGGVQRGIGDSVNGNIGINHRFPWGTLVAADLVFGGDRRAVVSPLIETPIEVGPGYNVAMRLTATQPLLRGLGQDVGYAPKAIADANLSVTEMAELRTASEMSRDVLAAYWEIWFSRQAVAVQVEALELAQTTLDAGRERVTIGSMAALELLPIQTDIAGIREALVAAESDVIRRQVALARLIGWPMSAAWQLVVDDTPPQRSEPPPRPDVEEAASDNAPDLAELRAQVERARVDVTLAADRLRPRLDATAWLNVAGLGDRSVRDALSMFGGFEALSFFVGLDFEIPVDRSLLEGELGGRRIAVQEAEQVLERVRQQVVSAAADSHEAWRAAMIRLQLAEETVAIANASTEAQRQRLDAGAGTVFEWLTALQEARRASLRLSRAKADVAIARAATEHLMGLLVDRLVPLL